MTNEFSHAAGIRILEEIRQIFEKKEVFQRRDKSIAFVCGGSKDDPRTMRSQFLKWIKTAHPSIIAVLAEDAFRSTYFHNPPLTINLSKFESLIAEISDCVIIFPESIGSFVEVGLFSNVDKIRAKTLIVNDLDHHSKDSFTNLGPIRSIDARSFLAATIPVSIKVTPVDFEPVRERLLRVVQRRRRIKFNFVEFRSLDRLSKFVLVFELVRILRLVSLEGLWQAVKIGFGGVSKTELKLLLSILMSAEWIESIDDHFQVTKSGQPLLDYDRTSIDDISARVVFYHTRYKTRVAQLLRKAGR